MSPPKSSQMMAGFNHNINHKGKIYHIQTEDSGITNPHIITHLFVGGNILATKKTSYADIVKAENLQDVVVELMQEQHKAMLRNLINGVYDGLDSSISAPPSEPAMPVAPVAQFPGAFAAAPAPATPRTAATPAVVLPKPSAPPQAVPRPSVPPPAVSQPPPPTAPAMPWHLSPPPAKELPAAPVVATPMAAKPVVSPLPPGKFPPPAMKPSQPASRPPVAVTLDREPTQPVIPSAGGPWRPPSQTKIHPPPPPEQVPVAAKQPAAVTIRPRAAPKAPPPTQPGMPQAAGKRQLPPEVLAARRLVNKPVANTAGPTIFGEDLISEKSLDEVILSYLSGDGEERR